MSSDLIPPAAAGAFLDRAGWSGAAIAPLAVDASFRRYFRVVAGHSRSAASAVLMDAPPVHEDAGRFIAIAQWLRDRGFAAPRILASALSDGLVLLEDFGDVRMREAVDADPASAPLLYASAVDLLIAIGRHPPAMLGGYSAAVLLREARLFKDFYCPAVGLTIDDGGFDRAWSTVFDAVQTTRPVTVLRDYHSENLMLVDGGLGLLDFQDALVGHPAYDLVSLLQDARRDVPASLEREMIARYRSATNEDGGFTSAYHVLGAQRNAKILGIFSRLWRRDGKPRYAAMCPRVWRYLERDLAHPALAPVAAWFEANVPEERRGDPIMLSAAATGGPAQAPT